MEFKEMYFYEMKHCGQTKIVRVPEDCVMHCCVCAEPNEKTLVGDVHQLYEYVEKSDRVFTGFDYLTKC